MPAPAIDPTIQAYERGTQAILALGATTTLTQTGTAKPATANAYGLPPVLRGDVESFNIGVQLDINRDAGSGTFSSLIFNILASLDGVNFYVQSTITVSTGLGGFFQIAGLVARYISVSITTATIGSGAPQATISFVA